MSWLARSIANSLKIDDDHDDGDPNHNPTTADSPSPPPSPNRGVKEDISELTKTLTSSFWGVASFLTPPPTPPKTSDDPSGTGEAPDPASIGGIKSDFAEIGGRFRSGISKLSGNLAVSDIKKMASDFLQLESDEIDYDSARGAVGVTDEVVAFVRDIAMHPETWLDFPLFDDEDDEDFDMSDAQQEHALAVERLAPRLAALRIELCPGYMNEDCFWKIYFVLLHPRLDRQDAELLSTPQMSSPLRMPMLLLLCVYGDKLWFGIHRFLLASRTLCLRLLAVIVKARASLTQELQPRTKALPEQDWSSRGTSYQKETANTPEEERLSVPSTQFESVPLETSTTASTVAADFETEKHPVLSTEIQIVDKSVVKEEPVNRNQDQNHSTSSSNVIEEKDEDDGDDWLKEESSEIVGSSGTTIPIDNDEDVSFSDLEEDDGDVPTSHEKVTYGSDSSAKDSREWVQLSRSSGDSTKDISSVTVERAGSETKGANEWLDVDDIDVAVDQRAESLRQLGRTLVKHDTRIMIYKNDQVPTPLPEDYAKRITSELHECSSIWNDDILAP
ncbi:hypothetical protein RJ639_017483 [Escallonia herrerae]|uniref:BSD domain-containing protein n=1 Tax=Escallonia herrerae TaxID=1293975 RepID=A0AA88VCY9_9ASTE|nr:hypothetical protein RJ639_017483 [Escallonia herrerae]